MPSDEKILLSGAAEFMIEYEKKADEIRSKYPNCIVVRGLQDFQTYLSEYRMCGLDVLEVFPWSKNSFIRTAHGVLPFIFVNRTARELFSKELDSLSVYGKRASKLYSARDLATYFRDNLKSTLHTVLVPVSLFVNDIEAFRHDFIEEKHYWLGEKNSKKKIVPITNHWESVAKHIAPNVLAEALEWENDLEDLKQKQQKSSVTRVTLPGLETFLPEKLLPRFLSPKEVATRNDCAATTSGQAIIQRRGWVRHELTTPYGALYGYTPGPLLGQSKHWPDYHLGATVIMLAHRAEKLVGTQALKHARHWNIPRELIIRQWDSFKADAFQPLSDMEFLHPLKNQK